MSQLASAASLFAVGFEGTSPSAEVLELIRRGVSGVVLFGRNVESAAQVAALVRDLKRAAATSGGNRSLLVAIDQEGGRVARLREAHGFTEMPAMRTLGATGDTQLAERVGAVFGRELRAVGIDLDFAPVLDVDTNPDNPVIADRSLGRDPETVARLGVAILAGLQSHGVAACAKHFPGHGDTRQDSHFHLPRLPHDVHRLNRTELPPFHAAIRAGVASIMTAHVVFDAVDPSLPATMSRDVLTGLLREQLGFGGAVISDDLEMKAIADHFGVADAAVRGAAAGVDLFLVCRSADRAHAAIDALDRAAINNDVPAPTLEAARLRVAALLQRWAEPPRDGFDAAALRAAEHLAVADAVRRASEAPTSTNDPTERFQR